MKPANIDCELLEQEPLVRTTDGTLCIHTHAQKQMTNRWVDVQCVQLVPA